MKSLGEPRETDVPKVFFQKSEIERELDRAILCAEKKAFFLKDSLLVSLKSIDCGGMN